jgi:hypothetical protein
MMVLARETGWALSELESRPVMNLEFWFSILEEQKDVEEEMYEEKMEANSPRGG